MSAPRFQRALVVGASSGIGAELVRQLARGGTHVAAVARRRAELEAVAQELAGAPGKVTVLANDVTDVASVPAAFEEAVRALGGLDLLVYAAGIMPAVGSEEYDTEKDLAMLDANLGGCVAWGNVVARYFHSQRAGTIVGIGSIAG